MNSPAVWIWPDDRPDPRKQSVFFRRTRRLERVESTRLRLSADSRYKLAVNGRHVLTGPLKGDRFRRYYDEVDITPYLKAGDNVLAVQVLRFPPDYRGAMAFQTGAVSLAAASRGGFWLDCETDREWDTSAQWKCRRDDSYTFVEACESKYAGDQEHLDGRRHPAGWQEADFDDCDWPLACVTGPADDSRLGGVLYDWQLTRRDIPLLYETPLSPAGISNSDGAADYAALLAGRPVALPAGEHWFDVDMGELVNAYVGLELDDAPDGAALELTYSEAYWTPAGDGSLFKGRRDNAGGTIAGECDRYLCRRGSQRYEPFWFRVFRYLRVRVISDGPLTITALSCRLTGYPLDITGRFSAAQPLLNRMWEVSRRTLERCMLDTYVDCPYYEQMQYIMDTMIQTLLNYQLSTDDRLVRKALLDFHATRRPDGMIACNAPAAFDQVIPIFSIYYIDLLAGHYRYFGDRELVARDLPTVIGILQYFTDRLDPATGLVGDTGYWRFVDWVDEWRANHGSPVSGPDETIHVYSQMAAYGMSRCAWLCGELGLEDLKRVYEERYRRLTGSINTHAYDAQSGWYRTHTGEHRPSQHAQVWAVLSGCVRGKPAADLMRRCISDRRLLPCSYSMSFYLLRACELAGIYDEYGDKWMPWERLLDLGVTTWPEDDITARSDCHAWSAVPLYDFTATVMGLVPGKPGFEELLLCPHSPAMGDMRVTLPTVRGTVEAARTVTRTAEGYGMRYTLHLPPGMPLRVRFPDGAETLYHQPDVHVDIPFIDASSPAIVMPAG